MRKLLILACAAVAMFSASLVASNRADAMAITTPAGVLPAVPDAATSPVEQVAYVCRWNGYRRVCWWRPNYGYRPYGFYGYRGGWRGYGYRRGWRGGWRGGRRW